MFKNIRGIAALALCMACSIAWPITAADLERLQIGSVLELPAVDVDTPALVTMVIQSTTRIADTEGYQWQRLDGTFHDGKRATLVMHIEKDQVEVESAIAHLKLRDLGINPKTIWQIDKQGQGEILYDAQHYQFNAEESDDAQYSKDHTDRKAMSYYRFESVEDDDLALLVFEWAEDKFEVLHLEWVDAEKVQLK